MNDPLSNRGYSRFKALTCSIEYKVPKGYASEDRVFLMRSVCEDIRFSPLRWTGWRDRMAAIFEQVQKRKVAVEKVARAWRTPHCDCIVSSWNDFPMVGTDYPAFSERTVEALGNLLTDHGVLLPVKCRRRTYFCFVPRLNRNILDMSKSTISKRMRVKRWMQPLFLRYEFNQDEVRKVPVFSIPDDLYATFVTNAFVKKVVSSGLVGFNCEIVYPLRRSEHYAALAYKNLKRHLSEGLPRGCTVSGDRVMVKFLLDHQNRIPTKREELLITKWAMDANLELWDSRSMDIPPGYLFRIEPDTGCLNAVFKGPNRKELAKRLLPLVDKCKWPGTIRVGGARI